MSSTYSMSPLVRFTLLSLYIVLVLPLLFLSWPHFLLASCCCCLGLVFVVALTSQKVRLDDNSLEFVYPVWCRWLFRRGWRLDLSNVASLLPVATSQGGSVFYIQLANGSSFLFPQRIERFEEFLEAFAVAADVDVGQISRLTPPWTYKLLAVLCFLMFIGEVFWFCVVARAPFG